MTVQEKIEKLKAHLHAQLEQQNLTKRDSGGVESAMKEDDIAHLFDDENGTFNPGDIVVKNQMEIGDAFPETMRFQVLGMMRMVEGGTDANSELYMLDPIDAENEKDKSAIYMCMGYKLGATS